VLPPKCGSTFFALFHILERNFFEKGRSIDGK